MTPKEFRNSVHLGDRACKAILVEGWAKRVSLHVDVISRVRSASGTWDFYTDEDIADGRLVFTGVRSVRFEPSGPVPNDWIEVIDVEERSSGTDARTFVFTVSVGAVDQSGVSTEVTIEIHADDLHLEDPRNPALVIRS